MYNSFKLLKVGVAQRGGNGNSEGKVWGGVKETGGRYLTNTAGKPPSFDVPCSAEADMRPILSILCTSGSSIFLLLVKRLL